MARSKHCILAVLCLFGLSSTTIAAPTATSVEYLNLGNFRHFDKLNVLPAWARGGTGRGVTIAVVDTGIDLDHPEFVGRINPNGRNFLGGGGLEDDATGHGTAVAGIIAANHQEAGIVGVAYQANILPYKIFNNESGGRIVEVLNAINAAAANPQVKVINLSFGGSQPFPGELAAVQAALNAGKFVAVAAGNSAAGSPDFPGAFASRIGPGFIVVGALGLDGQIAFFSNRAGATMNSFLLAPGTNIWTTKPGGSFRPVNGTSFSAAYVSGAAAVLFQLFPNLTGNEVGAILLASADDIGPPGPDPINGRGKLNLGRAAGPMGDMTIPAGGVAVDGGAPLSSSALQISPAIGSALLADPERFRQTVFLDSFDRAYVVDLGKLIEARPARNSFANLFASQLEDIRTFSLSTLPGQRLSIGYTPARTDWVELDEHDPNRMFGAWNEFGLGEVALSFSGSTTAMGYRFDVNQKQQRVAGIVADPSTRTMGFMSYHALSTPYLGFAEREHAVTTELSLNEHFGMNFVYSLRDESAEHGLTSSSAMTELVWRPHRRTSLHLRMGQLQEQGSLFGGASGGSFSIEEATTRSAGLGISWAINNNWRMVANADFGSTRVTQSEQSLLHSFSNLVSDAYSLGLIASNLWRQGDTLGLALTRPLRVRRGSSQLSIPTSMDAQEVLTRENTTLDLAAGSHEIDLEAYYRLPLGRNTHLAGNLLFALNPNHVRGADPSVAVSASLRHDF